MSEEKKIFCAKLKQSLAALSAAPFPGPMGEKIYHNISQQAWNQWISHQTMLINEYRLNTLDLKSKTFLKDEMNQFLFGEGSNKPVGYTPQTDEFNLSASSL
jgi:Fe-S cluster biosynthesis and repair protein YggX